MNNLKWINKKRNIDDLIPASYNPRKLTEKQKEQLKESMARFDVCDPIIINTNNIVIGGHQRLKVLKEQGVKEVDVRVPDRELTLDEEKELNVRLNKNTGEFDLELLADFDKDMLIDIGFELEDLDKIYPVTADEKDDVVPEVAQNECGVVRGDIWQLGNHRLMCGDSTSVDDVEKLMDGKKANAFISDPPYLMGFEGNVHADGSKSHNAKFGAIKNDKMSDEEGNEFIKEFMTNASIYTSGAFYVFWYRLGLHKLFRGMGDVGIDYKALIIWDKGNHTLSNSDYMSRYEPITYGWFGEHKFYGGSQYDIWKIDRTKKNDLHPTMKPVELMVQAVQHSTQHNGYVLDLFLGSGSTLIACEKTSRVCYGMELDEHYCSVIIKRWEEFTGNKAERLVNG